ncbi:MAG: HisA/HisF-related TIM barrel protein, partial [Firmicutes bacterium]|nr:HisA/HisF-related TIM barrel protein [Bacillota bacterium]
DVKRNGDCWNVYINGGKTNTSADAIKWIVEAKALGAGEVLLTSMDTDGVRDGYDNELYAAATSAVDIPVIASGGAGCMQHFYDVIKEGKVSGALAASVFHYGQVKIADLKEFLHKKGVAVREVENRC